MSDESARDDIDVSVKLKIYQLITYLAKRGRRIIIILSGISELFSITD
ncbi:MAG: hypothetical protein ACR5K4_00680 [Sodalis sp. (in: enterobacteria)]